MRQKPSGRNTALRFIVARLLTASIMSFCVAAVAAPPAKAPTPLLKTGQPVDWWFVFKFNAETFPGCGGLRNGSAPLAARFKPTNISASSSLTRVAPITNFNRAAGLISKPSNLRVPPWQMVSALLGSEPLRAATWWARPEIPTTKATTVVGCWDPSLAKPGAVEIATTGIWAGSEIGLERIPDPDGNHAKIGESTDSTTNHSYAIFGDMNQQGSLSGPNCKSSQDGRGGLFYVVDDSQLFSSVRDLINGGTAPQ